MILSDDQDEPWVMIKLGDDHIIHFCKRNHIEKNYRINSIMKILKFSQLNLNIFKEFQ
jgi:hypothetical protein